MRQPCPRWGGGACDVSALPEKNSPVFFYQTGTIATGAPQRRGESEVCRCPRE